MELCLEHLTAQERELCISANSLAETEQALKRLDNLESNAQVSVFPTLIKIKLFFCSATISIKMR